MPDFQRTASRSAKPLRIVSTGASEHLAVKKRWDCAGVVAARLGPAAAVAASWELRASSQAGLCTEAGTSPRGPVQPHKHRQRARLPL